MSLHICPGTFTLNGIAIPCCRCRPEKYRKLHRKWQFGRKEQKK